MTYLVVDNCIKCKHMDCVEYARLFLRRGKHVVINPEECIDCGGGIEQPLMLLSRSYLQVQNYPNG